MKRLIVLLLVCAVFLTGCNTGVAFSLMGDLIKLRVDREAAGEGHIEDVFIDTTKNK